MDAGKRRVIRLFRAADRQGHRAAVLVLLVIILSLPMPCIAAVYYVDYTGGSNSNSGLSTGSPWKHCPGDANASGVVATTVLQPGDSVLFKRGVTYRGRISPGQSGSVVAAGSTATVSTAGVVTDANAAFLTAGVQAGHYIYIFHSKASTAHTWVESCGLFRILAVQSNTQMTLSGFDGVAHSTAEMTYRIVNPIVYKSIAEWGTGEAVLDAENTRDSIFNADAKNVLRFEDLKLANVAWDGTEGGKWKAAIIGGTDIHVVSCKSDNVSTGSVAAGYYNVIKGCQFTNVGFFVVPGARYMLFEGNSVYGGTRTAWGRRFMIFRYNNLINAGTGTWQGYHGDALGPIDHGDGGVTEYWWVYGNLFDNFIQGIAIYGTEAGTRYGVIHSNVFLGRYAVTGYGDNAITVQGGSSVLILNNTFIGVGGLGFITAFSTTDGAGLTTKFTFKNNIYYMPQGGQVHRLGTGGTEGHAIDSNHYFAGEVTFRYNYPSNPSAEYISTWRSRGYDVNSMVGSSSAYDPKFNNASTGDVRLTSSSPCRNSGLTLSQYFTLDKNKRSRGALGGWAKGAYEATAPVQTVNPPANLRVLGVVD